MKSKCPPPAKKTSLDKKPAHSNTATDQRARLLTALREGPISTIEARHELKIMAPAPRIFELKHRDGHNIVTHRETIEIPDGNKHRGVAVYILMPGKWKGGV